MEGIYECANRIIVFSFFLCLSSSTESNRNKVTDESRIRKMKNSQKSDEKCARRGSTNPESLRIRKSRPEICSNYVRYKRPKWPPFREFEGGERGCKGGRKEEKGTGARSDVLERRVQVNEREKEKGWHSLEENCLINQAKKTFGSEEKRRGMFETEPLAKMYRSKKLDLSRTVLRVRNHAKCTIPNLHILVNSKGSKRMDR